MNIRKRQKTKLILRLSLSLSLHLYIYIYIYTNLHVNVIVRLPHPRSGERQDQETFLAPSANKQARNYDTECSWLTISFCYGSFPLTLGLIGKNGGLDTLCHSCRFSCQQRVLKTFPDPGYLLFKDGVVSLWHLLVSLYLWLIISSSYSSIPLTLGLIARNGGFYICVI